MKKIILILIFIFSNTFSQSGYTVEIHKTELWWASNETWRIELEAIIKYNGNPIPNSYNYSYQWWFDPDEFWEIRAEGLGLNTTDSDDFLNEIQHWYVIVSDVVNYTFTNLTSETITVSLNGTPRVSEVYVRVENPRGELGYYIISDGIVNSFRVKVRAPSFVNLAVMDELCRGHMVADVIAILGSVDIVLGEIDR